MKKNIEKYYTSAMEYWKGRVDSDTDYDAFRWHQWVQPIDLSDESLEPFDGKLGFAFIGFCSEQGIKRNKGRVGSALAPDFIRGQMSNLPCAFSQEVKLFDAGNIICEGMSMENGQIGLGHAVEKILSLNLFPIVLGGGHETTFGHFLGEYHNLRKASGKTDPAGASDLIDEGGYANSAAAGAGTGAGALGEAKARFGIVNFDAHFDLRPYNNGSSSGSMFRQIADICHDDGEKYRYMPLGIQQHSNTVQLFKVAKALGVNYILAKDFQTMGYASILEKVDLFMGDCENAYMTICTDVFSSAFAPGVSATQSLGLDPEVVLPVIKHILRTRKVKGFDICEISPRFDQDNTTANLGAVIIFAVVSTLCKMDGLDIDLDDISWM